MTKRRTYKINITVNYKKITKVIIDPHFEIKHADTIEDKVILNLVQLLDGEVFVPEVEKDGFLYFKNDPLILEGIP